MGGTLEMSGGVGGGEGQGAFVLCQTEIRAMGGNLQSMPSWDLSSDRSPGNSKKATRSRTSGQSMITCSISMTRFGVRSKEMTSPQWFCTGCTLMPRVRSTYMLQFVMCWHYCNSVTSCRQATNEQTSKYSAVREYTRYHAQPSFPLPPPSRPAGRALGTEWTNRLLLNLALQHYC